MIFRTSKTVILAKTFIDFWKIDFLSSKMVLGAFWRSLGLLLGPLGGFLGDFWRLLGVSSATFGGFRSNTNGWHALSQCVLELLMSSVDLVVSFFWSSSSFLSSFFWILKTSQLKTSLLIRISRKSKLNTWFLKCGNQYVYCFFMTVSAEILGFQNSRDVSMNFPTFSIDITVGIWIVLLILDVFPS